MAAVRLHRNPAARLAPARPESDAPLRFHRSLPGYAPTPLVDAPAAAAELGVARVLVKDESARLGMPSFKILGASWATYRALCARVGADPGGLEGLRAVLDAPLELVAATDGNHGRAVARMAALLGLTAHVLVPRDTVAARIDAIAVEGARVTVVDGSYDDAVAASAALADADHVVISDTSWPGYEEVPAWVIEGYATIGQEIDAQLGASTPDAVAVQIGVGAFAAAMVSHFRPRGATLVGVEPASAGCAIASSEAGRIVTVPGPHDSIMAGLNCGAPSLIAWPVLTRGVDVFTTVGDDAARRAMRLLARDGIVAGESGAAGLAGLLEHRDALGLRADQAVLTVSTEGATDPVAYREIVGTEVSA